jgi:hypothetical protein
MDIYTAAKYMQIGYRIRRTSWRNRYYISWDEMLFTKLFREDLVADDWEVITQGIIRDFPITYQE